MYKIDKKYGNLNRKTYIDLNFEHLGHQILLKVYF